jgi:hypothetical protein
MIITGLSGATTHKIYVNSSQPRLSSPDDLELCKQ